MTNNFVFEKDLAAKKIHVVREFNAPIEKVWKAWTEPRLLDQWWAPKPWKAITQSMDFRKGGKWLYYMEGPDGTRQYCRADYSSVIANKHYSGEDAFTDEKGNINKDMPHMHWEVEFSPSGEATEVEVEITFTSKEDMDKIIEMGFKDGFAAAHKNLDELLEG